MVPYFQRVDVPGSLVERSVTDRDTHTQTTVPLLRMRAEAREFLGHAHLIEV